VLVNEWTAHDFEAWIVSWNYWDGNVVLSGGDDCKLKGWDLRQGFERPTFVNKNFGGGVTSIQSNPHAEHIVAVGSYDSTVNLFDLRSSRQPLTTCNVGGGAWRIKWHPSPERKSDALVACMHDGFKVVRFNDLSNAEVTKRWDAHGSLAYGVDWSHWERGDQTIVASCSFYDHSLQLWEA